MPTNRRLVENSPIGAKANSSISLVIPVYNERENLAPLHTAICSAMSGIGFPYEIIFVDDGSDDGSAEVLRELAAQDPRVCVIRFRRNFGQTAAIMAGFDYAAGQIVVTLDADLQNDPQDIPKLLAKIAEGYDIVSGWRKDRKESFWTRRLPSQVANWLISVITGVHLRDQGCTLKAYRTEVVKGIRLYGEMHRFIPAIASWMGVAIAEVPVNHHARVHGKSKYGLSRTIKVLLDLITLKLLLSYSTRPMRLFGLLGLFCLGIGILLTGYLGFVRLFLEQAIGERPLLLLAILLDVLGVQFFMMGLLGELIVRTYHEAQGKPIYSVREVLNEH